MHRPPIPTKKVVCKVKKEEWHGKPKGVLQILWERGYIDSENVEVYTMKGRKDKDGVIDKRFRLNKLIRTCPDFVNEPTMLKYIGVEKLGILVDRTPKCTPELTGEGIEYCWTCGKGWYR